MCCIGVLRRFVPFLLTFAVGLFIASFFVSIAAPTFRFNNGWRRHEQYHRMLEFENQQLRERNSLLEKKLAVGDSQDSFDRDAIDLAVPPPPPPPPMPPAKARFIPYNGR